MIIKSTGVLAAGALLLAGCGGEGGPSATVTVTEGTAGAGGSESSSSTPSGTSSSVDCSATSDLSQSEWIDNCAKGSEVDGTPAPQPEYSDPVEMKDKVLRAVPYMRCESDADTAEYDMNGTLATGCTGRNGESITFRSFKTEDDLLENLEYYSDINSGSEFYTGAAWAVSAENPRTLEEISNALDPENAAMPGPLTKQEAKREYQRMVEPFNSAAEDGQYVDPEYSDISEYTDYCSTLVDESDALAAELEYAAWPAGVSATVKPLIADVKKDRKTFKACADATTTEAAQGALDGLGGDRTNAAAVRKALGLKQVG